MPFSFKTTALIFLLSITALNFVAQNVKIKGRAHVSHINKPVELYSYSDLITYTQTKEAIDTVDKNGYFELNLKIKNTEVVFLKIDNLAGKLYIQPDFVYGITFPSKDTFKIKSTETEELVNLGILSADTTELNTLIIDFNNQYDKFFASAASEFLNKKRIHQKTDSLQIICSKRYAKIKNPYFKNYLSYTFANINANSSRGKNYLKENYLNNKPVLHNQFEYMEFFNAYFKGYLDAMSSSKPGETVYHLINSDGKWEDLNAFLKADKFLTNDTLRELVAIRNLWDYYYSPQFDSKKIAVVIEQFWGATKIEAHKTIAANILKVIYKLQPGVTAPAFTAADKTGKAIGLINYKGKYIYLNFFSTNNTESLKEMPKIFELNKKWADRVTFISICTDDSLKTYKAYLKANPKFNWQILFSNSEAKGSTAKDLYNVKGAPAFYFINQYGNLLQSPALAPSEGFEFKLKALFKPKRSSNKIGIR